MLVDGHVDPGLEPVRTAFEGVVGSQPGTGAAMAVWRAGDLVVDLWGGWADAARSRPWERDTLAHPYSVAKPFAAVCVLLLVDRGLVGLDDDVRRYWPDLQTPMTVRHLLSHQSGLVALDEPAPTAAYFDWDRMCALLAAQAPAWEPGTAHGEAALFFGHPLGQVVRAVDGRTLGTFLAEEVCRPLGLDFHIGLPTDEHHRVAELTGFESFGPAMSEGRPALFDRALRNPPGALDGAVVNSAPWRRAEVPAVNGIGTARAVAQFYAALATGDLLSTSLREQATSVVVSGEDRVLGFDNAWGLGFGVDSNGYGMGGIGGHIGWWDTTGDYAFAFVTGHLGDYDRMDRCESALRECLGLPPLED
jgi:CubicO group peptidase (beta-lactamase class C family)